MKKKKITPQDLELNIEIIGGKQLSPRFTETKTCGFNCNTIDPTLPDCKTIEEAGCVQTQTCWTIEPECETKAGCQDSHSHAQLCCPATEQTGCRKTVDNCLTVDICGPNTLNICLETSKDCKESMECYISKDGQQQTCTCMLSEEDNSCKPMEPNTFVTTC